MVINQSFWAKKKVFLTGHTGFKGTWLSLYLNSLGAKVYGYSLPNEDKESIFHAIKVESFITSRYGDIRNLDEMYALYQDIQPDVVFHLAAQSLVKDSYRHPVNTFSTNIIGTVNVLEMVRMLPSAKSVIVVTSDKCYQNNEWLWRYRENDMLGGDDPYSNSKACCEFVTDSYRKSFFGSADTRIATVRSGNVIGGGDRGLDRLIPDYIRARKAQKKLRVRSPNSIRPWQHVLEPLSGYIMLAEKLYHNEFNADGAWNFGPSSAANDNVRAIIKMLSRHWDEKVPEVSFEVDNVKEAKLLSIDSAKANIKLGWSPRWRCEEAIKAVVAWEKAYEENSDMLYVTEKQIGDYLHS